MSTEIVDEACKKHVSTITEAIRDLGEELERLTEENADLRVGLAHVRADRAALRARAEKAEAERDALLEMIRDVIGPERDGESNPYCPDNDLVGMQPTTWGKLRKMRAAVASHQRGTSGVASHSPWGSSHETHVGRWPDAKADAAAREEEECEQPQPGGEE